MHGITSGPSVAFLYEPKRFGVGITYRAGKIALRNFSKTFASVKSDGTPVTPVDFACERLVVKAIQKTYPDHRILGEETGVYAGSSEESCWTIDPLSGTKNFMRGEYPFGIALALWHQDEPVMGVRGNIVASLDHELV